MARFNRMAIAADTPAVDSQPIPAGEQAVAAYAALVARDAVRRTPAPPPEKQDQFTALRRVSMQVDDPVLERAAVDAAARLWCMKSDKAGEADIKAVGQIARFLVWAAFGGVVDEGRALTRAVADEYLAVKETTSEKAARQKKYVLYGVGRLMNPHEFPPPNEVSAPRRKGVPAANGFDIARLQAVIPGLPTALGQRAQAVLDLALGAGTRAGDFKTLRGTAITSIAVDGHAVAVVTLPNHNGGVRQVPVVDPKISARLLGLTARVAHGLVLAPKAVRAERNIVNRVNSDLRSHGHPGMDPIALRNRWVLDLANTVPAALLLQLADVSDLRVLVDQYSLLSTFTLRHAITLLKENLQ
jgi:hypothetical protein